MNPWVCSICGRDTKCVDMDYLINYDHISCHLGVWGGQPTHKSKLKKHMKIENWDKISGYTYKGYTIVNPIYSPTGNKYYADVLNLNLPQKPKWHLELSLAKNNTLVLTDTNGFSIQHLVESVDIRTAGLFRVRYEEILDDMLVKQLLSTNTPSSHSISGAYSKQINPNYYGTVNINHGANGILNTIASTGTNIVYNNTNAIGTSITQSSIIDTIKDLQNQIEQLKAQINPPSNPF